MFVFLIKRGKDCSRFVRSCCTRWCIIYSLYTIHISAWNSFSLSFFIQTFSLFLYSIFLFLLFHLCLFLSLSFFSLYHSSFLSHTPSMQIYLSNCRPVDILFTYLWPSITSSDYPFQFLYLTLSQTWTFLGFSSFLFLSLSLSVFVLP